MKQIVRVIDTDGKVIEKEFNTRNEGLFKASLLNKSKVFIPKKGKGSYSRKSKHKKEII